MFCGLFQWILLGLLLGHHTLAIPEVDGDLTIDRVEVAAVEALTSTGGSQKHRNSCRITINEYHDENLVRKSYSTFFDNPTENYEGYVCMKAV